MQRRVSRPDLIQSHREIYWCQSKSSQLCEAYLDSAEQAQTSTYSHSKSAHKFADRPPLFPPSSSRRHKICRKRSCIYILSCASIKWIENTPQQSVQLCICTRFLLPAGEERWKTLHHPAYCRISRGIYYTLSYCCSSRR